VWPHIIRILFGPYQCVYGALFGIRLRDDLQQDRIARSLMMLITPKHVGVFLM